ncbi:unnamed protein product [Owenia fusiformis]|uniref:Uncharacterized protein n=1 Tax=Owenia fusiformis TaxID=6347 RepID=A0A8J1US53_OWEFU|nr:unnamed protein product [Owenia fusiformis]
MKQDIDITEQFANLSVRKSEETVHVLEKKTYEDFERIQNRLLGLPKDMERSASFTYKKGSRKGGRYAASRARRSDRRHTVIVGEEAKQIQQNYDYDTNTLTIPSGSLHTNAYSESELTLYRVRSFKKTSRGIKNRGDSFKVKSTSNISVASLDSGHHEDISRKNSSNSDGLDLENDLDSPYKVLLLGTQETGKSALAQQFMTSEYMGDCDSLLGETSVRTVSVLLNGEESSMQFFELETEEDHADYCDVDGYIVVYSVTDRRSFTTACDLVKDLREVLQKQSAITLVGNKSDIVRQRQISDTDGMEFAKSYGCKFIETSAVLNHNIDELLVETLSNIRHVYKTLAKQSRRTIGDAAKGLIKRVFKSRGLTKSRSMETLCLKRH